VHFVGFIIRTGSEIQRLIPARQITLQYPFSRKLCEPGDSQRVLDTTVSLAPAAIPTSDVPARSLITVLSRSSIIRGICRI